MHFGHKNQKHWLFTESSFHFIFFLLIQNKPYTSQVEITVAVLPFSATHTM